MHVNGPQTDIDEAATIIKEAAQTMAELIQEGKILHWSVFEADEEYCLISVIENSYSIINHKHESLFAFLEENNISWIAFSPLMKGLLTNSFQKGVTFAKDDWLSGSMIVQPIYQQNLEIILKNWLKNASPAQLSLAWILNKKPYIVSIPGMKKTLSWKCNSCWYHFSFTRNGWNWKTSKWITWTK